MRGGRILGSGAVGVLVASLGVALATATTATAAAAAPTTAAAGALPAAAASPCASTPGGNDVIFTASDPTPATVTATVGSTIATITFTSKTYFDYLYPVFSIDTRNNNDGIKPTYSPPSFEYSVNGGSWSGIAATFDTSGDVGGDVWAADLPEWQDLANGSVTTLRMKVTFNGSMPHGSYDSWFGVRPDALVCGVEQLSPIAAHLSPFTYSPAAVATTRPASSSPAAAPTHTAVGAGNASAAADASGTASAHAPTGSASASASGSVSPSASGSADIGASASASGSAPTALNDAQNAAADRAASSSGSGSGSGTLVWVLVLAAVVVFGGVGGTFAARRRRSRT